jgi:UV DNA damage endonuclease
MSEETGCPVVFDTHHYTCYNQGACKQQFKLMKEAREYIPLVLETWSRRGIKPKFHISEQRCDARIGCHSDYVEVIPEYLLEIPEIYNVDIDIMIEAKEKEKSVFYLYQKYPQLSPF